MWMAGCAERVVPGGAGRHLYPRQHLLPRQRHQDSQVGFVEFRFLDLRKAFDDVLHNFGN